MTAATKRRKPGTATEALEALGIEGFVERILAGKTMASVAKSIGVSRKSLITWLAADPERDKRAREARIMSATAFDEMAEQAILGATDVLSLAKARELAQHYRWRASKIDPGYADRLGIGGAGPPIQIQDHDPIETARRLAFLLAAGVSAMDGQREPLRLVGPPTAEPVTHGTGLDGVEFRYGDTIEAEVTPSRPAPEPYVGPEEEPGLMWATPAEMRNDPQRPRVLHRKP